MTENTTARERSHFMGKLLTSQRQAKDLAAGYFTLRAKLPVFVAKNRIDYPLRCPSSLNRSRFAASAKQAGIADEEGPDAVGDEGVAAGLAVDPAHDGDDDRPECVDDQVLHRVDDSR